MKKLKLQKRIKIKPEAPFDFNREVEKLLKSKDNNSIQQMHIQNFLLEFK